MKIRVADWIMRRLAEEGIQYVFLLPGGGAMYLNDALVCESRLIPVPCHHEQACAIAAEACGRTGYSEQPGFGVVMVTTGPGATNVVTPLAGAWIDSVPMLVISGQAKRPDRLNGRPLRQGGVQEVDIVPIVQSITKYAATIEEPQEVRWHLEQALHLMKTGRPGPVWIDVPLDVQASLIEPETLRPWTAPMDVASPSNPDFAAIAALVAAAERPLILAGHGVRLSGAAETFQQFVKSLGIPTVLTWNALDLLPWSDPLNIGRPGVVASRAANFAVQNCDLLISIGCRLENIVTGYNPRGFARAARKVIVDIDANELQKLDMDIEHAVVLDAGNFMEGLLANSHLHKSEPYTQWKERCSHWKSTYPQNEGRMFPESGPISHAQFVEALSAAAPEDTLIATGSSGLAIEFFYAGFHNKPGQRTFLTSGLGAMGYGLPAAIGACLGHGKQPMLAVESDGSLQLNLQELATLVSQKLPICMFIMNNGGYASIRNTQRNYFDNRYVASGPESGLNMPSLRKLADTYGLEFMEITDCHNLQDQLEQAQQLARPCIIDVRLIPEEALAPKCAAIIGTDGSIVSMPLEDMSPLLSLAQLEKEMLVPLLPASLSAPRPVALT